MASVCASIRSSLHGAGNHGQTLEYGVLTPRSAPLGWSDIPVHPASKRHNADYSAPQLLAASTRSSFQRFAQQCSADHGKHRFGTPRPESCLRRQAIDLLAHRSTGHRSDEYYSQLAAKGFDPLGFVSARPLALILSERTPATTIRQCISDVLNVPVLVGHHRCVLGDS